MPPIQVEALGDGRLLVWNLDDARRLYNTSYYGKPLGIPKPEEDFNAPLILDPVEGAYLKERDIIQINSEEGDVTLDELIESSRLTHERFEEKYRVYRDLRDKGWIVTPGIKYGCDFAVYRHGPGIDHAPYIIQIMVEGEHITATEIVKAGRLATTVRKKFIMVLVEDDITYLKFEWWRA
ncbi:MAG: tRNA-intron lyase [Candidatus Bathyarchaeia archaeon]